MIFGLILVAAGCNRAPSPAALAAHQQALRGLLESKRPPPGPDARARQVWQETQQFYKDNGYALVWSDGKAPLGRMDGLIRAIRAADQDGLEAADYGIDELDRVGHSFDPSHFADVDVRFTYAYLRYASDLTHGTINPEEVDSHWHAAPRRADLRAALAGAVAENRDNSVGDSLQKLTPPAAQYKGLKHQLALARANGGTPETILQIAMNMDRWRWLPDDLGPRYLMVNIPAFRLDAIENGKSVLGMKVVTGKKDSPTPMLTDELTTVVFSPYWNIPSEIVTKEILPKLATDPDYLERNHIEMDESGQRYRQRPGNGNSLGGVKFLFPNHFNVYLHDTPAASLFNRIERDFSHGCVRVERPADLAKYVLRDQPEWTEARIGEAMHRGVEQSVALKQPLPIYLVYFTAWEENGALQTRPDVYGFDRRHVKAVDR